MSTRVWMCNTCSGTHRSNNGIWGPCPGCAKEVCDSCGWSYGHCKPCSEGKTDEQLRLAANATGEYDFEPDETFFSPAQIVDRIENGESSLVLLPKDSR